MDREKTQPWTDEVPSLSVYDWRGCRMLDKRCWSSKCFSCKWAAMANVAIEYNWGISQKFRFESFCYGPFSCKNYKMGKPRAVPDKQLGSVYDEGCWMKSVRRIGKTMTNSNMKSTSKFISLILRHHPEVIGITLDEHGWADVRDLIDGINKYGKHALTLEKLEEIVRTDEKQRYSFNGDHTKIRANQGHSLPVDVELEEKIPPGILYHGTGEKYVGSIDKAGLLPKSRLYVHLSKDIQTAEKVGYRHGKPVVYQVNAGQMSRDGIPFYLSANGVWLVKAVPVRYLSKIDENGKPSAPPELTDRQIYDTPIGPVCMSKTEHEMYLEEAELRKLKDK